MSTMISLSLTPLAPVKGDNLSFHALALAMITLVEIRLPSEGPIYLSMIFHTKILSYKI